MTRKPTTICDNCGNYTEDATKWYSLHIAGPDLPVPNGGRADVCPECAAEQKPKNVAHLFLSIWKRVCHKQARGKI